MLADYFLIASGSNVKQVQAMADSVEEVLGRAGVPLRQIEGYQNANWILMDYGDIIVHVFCREDRLFYDLERIWRDGKIMEEKLPESGLAVIKNAGHFPFLDNWPQFSAVLDAFL